MNSLRMISSGGSGRVFFFTFWCLLDKKDGEIVVLFNRFHFFMVVNQICNVTPVISWGFVDYEEDLAAPLLDYLWLTFNI